MLGARPHSHEAMTNSSTLAVNSLTMPMRCVSQPVSGSEIALATAKLVMTQVPWFGLTPRSPAMAGSDTLAIEVSSTFMNVAADSAIVPHIRAAPSSGGGGVCWLAAAVAMRAVPAAGGRAAVGRYDDVAYGGAVGGDHAAQFGFCTGVLLLEHGG